MQFSDFVIIGLTCYFIYSFVSKKQSSRGVNPGVYPGPNMVNRVESRRDGLFERPIYLYRVPGVGRVIEDEGWRLTTWVDIKNV